MQVALAFSHTRFGAICWIYLTDIVAVHNGSQFTSSQVKIYQNYTSKLIILKTAFKTFMLTHNTH